MTFALGILGLIFLIVIHELGHMLTAKAVGVRVPEFGVGFGPALFKKKIGKTVYSFRIILLGGFAKMAGMGDGEEGPGTYQSKAPWRRAAIILAGPMANVVAAVVIFTGIYMSGVPRATTEIADVVPDSLAAEANIQKGDRIVSVNGKEAGDWEGFVGSVGQKEPGDNVELVVSRDGEERAVSGELVADPENPGRALVGVRPVVVEDTYGPLAALGQAVGRCVEITVTLGTFVGDLVTGERSFVKNVSGPVGITSVASTSVAQGFFLPLLAIISLNLALFNLLPILPLDGGHLFFIAAEKLMGRPVSEQTMGKFAAFGVALVLMLFVFATYADLSKLFTGTPFIPE
ncbi:MAG: RIP metalloprotease RseP [Rubrobacter sp.]|nr:RIP metalloprotease RseP [Rubrobacter sp.]MDQ3376632.1 RIP metalloprotease RseP [Actinomycetota bacterium]